MLQPPASPRRNVQSLSTATQREMGLALSRFGTALRWALSHDPSLPPAKRRLRRRQVMLDQEVQGRLLGRVIAYWAIAFTSMGVGNWSWSLWTQDTPPTLGQAFQIMVPGGVLSAILLPVLMADMLRLSNRFVAPVFRLRNALKCLELGDRPGPLLLRRNDLWWDLTARFNALMGRLFIQERLGSMRESDLQPEDSGATENREQDLPCRNR